MIISAISGQPFLFLLGLENLTIFGFEPRFGDDLILRIFRFLL